MKMIKNIAIVVFASSFMFAGIGFHYANNYTDMDAGTNTATSWGVSYDLNDNTSVGWDSVMGMLMNFDAPMGVKLRLGWAANAADACVGADCLNADLAANGGDDSGVADEAEVAAWLAGDGSLEDLMWGGGNPASTSIGLGFTWWTGGTGVKTSVSTNYDYVMAPNAAAYTGTFAADYSNLSIVVGFGF